MRPNTEAPEGVARIHEVGFFSLNSHQWDNHSTGADLASTADHDEYNPRDPYTNNVPPPIYEHPCSPLMKILSSGTFYYALSPQWDISSRLSRRIVKGKQLGNEAVAYDDRFLWNEYIVRSLLDFREKLDAVERHEMDRCQFIVSYIRSLKYSNL